MATAAGLSALGAAQLTVMVFAAAWINAVLGVVSLLPGAGHDGGRIGQGGTTLARDNVFSFAETPPFTVTSWNPDVNGTVNTIAFNNGNCADAYIGGQFTAVGGTAARTSPRSTPPPGPSSPRSSTTRPARWRRSWR